MPGNGGTRTVSKGMYIVVKKIEAGLCMYWCGNTYTTLSARVATQDTYIFCKVVLNCIHVRVCVCRYRKLSRRTHRKWLIVSILEDDGSLCIGGKSVLHPVFLNCSHFLP